jgi:hypothetical protein
MRRLVLGLSISQLIVVSQSFATCVATPVEVAVMQVNHCIVANFREATTEFWSGTESIEGVLLTGTVVDSWHTWRQRSYEALPLPKPRQIGSSATFFFRSSVCHPWVGKKLNFVVNGNCVGCDVIHIDTGPKGRCMVPHYLPYSMIFDDVSHLR